jgi:hypothetical protein
MTRELQSIKAILTIPAPLKNLALIYCLAGSVMVTGCGPASPPPKPRTATRTRPVAKVAPQPQPRPRPRRAPTIVGSCAMLFHQYKTCKKMPLNEEAFVSMCDKLADNPRTIEEIKCSAQSDCTMFKKCLKVAQHKSRVMRMKKHWRRAMAEVNQGKYGRAMSFCFTWKADLPAPLKAKCKALPLAATKHLLGDITRKRDAGQVSYKVIKCHDLQRYAKKSGPLWLTRAELLCKEVDLARDLKRFTASVNKNLKKASPYLPYHCGERPLDRIRKIGSPYASKIMAQIIQACYRKLGRYILKMKLPKQKHTCSVKDVYKGIKKYKIRGKVIDRLMRKASRKCK